MIVNVCESGLETEIVLLDFDFEKLRVSWLEGLKDWDLRTVSEREEEFETCSVIDLVKVFVRSCVQVIEDDVFVRVLVLFVVEFARTNEEEEEEEEEETHGNKEKDDDDIKKTNNNNTKERRCMFWFFDFFVERVC